jgi:UDP-N-acetylmuramoylalanine--D-glutamate ligase
VKSRGGQYESTGRPQLCPEGRVAASTPPSRSADEFESRLGGVVPTRIAESLDLAVADAAERALPGEIVLLSPACASFDQYDNYMRRGEHFQDLVRGLEEAADG